jgi:hypothetical protein
MDVPQRYGTAIGRYLEDLEVRVNAAEGEAAMATDATGGTLGTEQGFGHGHGGRELADVRETGDEVSMGEASLLEASLDKVEDPAMPDDVWWAGD